jgi:hypothetical protein
MPRTEKIVVLNDEQREFATRWAQILEPYCKTAVQRKYISRSDYNDLYDLLAYHLCRTAAVRYEDSKRNHGTECMWVKKILRQKLNEYQVWKKRKKNSLKFISLEDKNSGAPSDYHSNSYLSYMKSLTDKKSIDSVDKELLATVIVKAKLGSRPGSFLVLHYLYGLSIAEIGRIFLLSRERVRQVIKSAVERIQEIIVSNQLNREDFFYHGVV